MDNQTHIYPVTVIRSRYGGVYDGGRRAALDCSNDEVPEATVGGVECAEFWAVARTGRYQVDTMVQ